MYTVILSNPDGRKAERQYTRLANAIKAAEQAVKAGYVYLNPIIELSKEDRKFTVEHASVVDDLGNSVKGIGGQTK